VKATDDFVGDTSYAPGPNLAESSLMTKADLYPFPKSARFWLLSLVKKSFGLY